MQQGVRWIDRWVCIDNNFSSTHAKTWASPPELDLPVENALNITITAEITGVGPACGTTTGPKLTLQGTSATTDIEDAWTEIGVIAASIHRTRYTAVVVFGQNNAKLSDVYARGLLRLFLQTASSTNVAFVRLRVWVDITCADGTHATQLSPLTADAFGPVDAEHHPQRWIDEFVFLDPSQTWAMPAAQFLPMANRTEAFYSTEFAAVGPGAGQIDFQRCAIPTEKDGAWQTMNNSSIPLARGLGYVHKSFSADGGSDLAPRGYQRVLLTNTDATAGHWTMLHIRTWAHVSGA